MTETVRRRRLTAEPSVQFRVSFSIRAANIQPFQISSKNSAKPEKNYLKLPIKAY